MRLHAVIFLLMFVSPGALAGNPVKRLLMSADSLLQKHYYKVDYDTAYISRSSGKIGLKAWGRGWTVMDILLSRSLTH